MGRKKKKYKSNIDERKKYWNEKYFRYWWQRVQEANLEKSGPSKVVKNDEITTPDKIYSELFEKIGFKDGRLLDVGCGWGRLFPIYAKHGMAIYGIDISSKMIEEARKLSIPELVELKESIAERIPYPTAFFDFVCCIGVFDATFQHKSLSEMMRICKMGGKIIVTGKNANYCADDAAALAAEEGALRKGEPNFFTDVPAMLDQLKKYGHSVYYHFYFKKRGDFANNDYTEIMPEQFYEYFLVIEEKTDKISFVPFSYDTSFTCEAIVKEKS